MSEATAELNPSAKMPSEQGSDIPIGWKPTVAEPVPVVRCIQIKKDGERCDRWSYRGATKCIAHLERRGSLKNVRAHADAVVEAARIRLLDNADLAVGTLEQLMQPGTGEGIRLKASTEVLDRAGIRGGFDIQVDQTVTVNPAETIADRLAKLKEGAQAVQDLRDKRTANPSPDIVDGEVVEDSDEQPTLF